MASWSPRSARSPCWRTTAATQQQSTGTARRCWWRSARGKLGGWTRFELSWSEDCGLGVWEWGWGRKAEGTMGVEETQWHKITPFVLCKSLSSTFPSFIQPVKSTSTSLLWPASSSPAAPFSPCPFVFQTNFHASGLTHLRSLHVLAATSVLCSTDPQPMNLSRSTLSVVSFSSESHTLFKNHAQLNPKTVKAYSNTRQALDHQTTADQMHRSITRSATGGPHRRRGSGTPAP